MKKFAMSLLTLFALTDQANASLIFSDVSYTENTLTFTVDGDFSDYTTPQFSDQFGIQYLGDIYSGPIIEGEYTINSWTPGFAYSGNTGVFYGDQTIPYTFSGITNYNPSNITITLTTGNYLNTNANNASINFVWGNGCFESCNGPETLLQTVNLSESISVPEPLTLTLFGFALAGLGFSRRKVRS